MPDLADVVATAFSPWYGTPCWDVRPGYASFLTFEFGEPHLRVREPREAPGSTPGPLPPAARRHAHVHGEWHLWIYGCNWRVTAGGAAVGDSSSDRRIRRAAAELNGQALVSVTTDRLRRWQFQFDLGGCLETTPFRRRRDDPADNLDQWLLYEPSGYVLTVRADGSYSHQPGNTPPEAERWRGGSL